MERKPENPWERRLSAFENQVVLMAADLLNHGDKGENFASHVRITQVDCNIFKKSKGAKRIGEQRWKRLNPM